MKATGIVRRIDDLGRIVIPKEIRRTLKIHEGSPLEIFTDSEGHVIFRKYSPVGEMSELAETYAETIATSLGVGCAVSDTEKILAVSGLGKKELKNQILSERMRNFLSQRKVVNTNEHIKICENSEKQSELTSMINSEGDPIGAVILYDIPNPVNTSHQVIAKTMANLIGRQAQ